MGDYFKEFALGVVACFIVLFLLSRTLISLSPIVEYAEINNKLYLKVNKRAYNFQIDIKEYGLEAGYYNIGTKLEVK